MLDRRSFVGTLFGSLAGILSGALRKFRPEPPPPMLIDADRPQLIAEAFDAADHASPGEAMFSVGLKMTLPMRPPNTDVFEVAVNPLMGSTNRGEFRGWPPRTLFIRCYRTTGHGDADPECEIEFAYRLDGRLPLPADVTEGDYGAIDRIPTWLEAKVDEYRAEHGIAN